MHRPIKERLQKLYPDSVEETYKKLEGVIEDFKKAHPTREPKKQYFSEKDVILITYADHVQEPGVKTLKTMKKFLKDYVYSAAINKVHFLPFFPYSSDDGFSVVDYYKIKEEFGDWEDVRAIGEDFGLMFDDVINHASQHSDWFKKYLAKEKPYDNYFIGYDEPVDVSQVFRPRTHPLLTKFTMKDGTIKYVWTTFSDDQIDLNFSDPDLMVEMMKVLLFYISQGAEVIRLDAIAYLWKKLGTNSIHLPETHEAVKLMRDVLEEAAPYVWIITETNVPHKDNISYFGNGEDEAHLVYNFTLPPMLIYSFMQGDATELSKWAATLKLPSDKTTFFNFTASHDGVGVTPLKGIIPDEEIKKVADHVLKQKGRINYRTVEGMEPQPYELNIVYMNAIGGAEQFVASQAIQMSIAGVPAIYLNSLIGAENWEEGVEKLGYNRAINRRKYDINELKKELEDPETTKHQVYMKYKKLLQVRTNEPLFSPHATQKILEIDPHLFAVLRERNGKKLLAIVNVSGKTVHMDTSKIHEILGKNNPMDIITQTDIQFTDKNVYSINPYEVLWLK